ncbi:MAG: FkbM family methyltransferase [Gemmataceae bacterium]|nr:FkbM family methyltransferase [Gemmataceae bacterium]
MGTLKLLVSRRKLRWFLPQCATLRAAGIAHPIHLRHGTTDKYALAEVLLASQYQCLAGMRHVRTIVDAGANIGAASVFLLNAYPQATLLALEPDPGNFSLLARNLRYYGSRAIPLQQALWSRREPLAIRRGLFRDGGEWSFQVMPAVHDAVVEARGTPISDLMQQPPFQTLDILKIDIEGAERNVFSAPDLSWLRNVRTIAIELHDAASRDAFLRAVSPLAGSLSRHGEVNLWRNGSWPS